MKATPIINFDVTIPSKASPEAVYTVLSDPRTHLIWAGEQAPDAGFKLLTMDAIGPLTVGGTFSSTGSNAKNGSMTFHDRSVIVQAEPGRAFGFDTESRLERRRAKTWFVHFEHRYTIEPADGGSSIRYRAAVYPQNYRPWWLWAPLRPMTRMMVHKLNAAHMRNLAAIAEQQATTAR